ncbi:MAG: AsmA-like C-terminal region-containing protein [Bacilli bacterium]
MVEGGENGEISVSISLEGDVKEFEKSSGGGYVNLENKDLIKLNLFGALSRAAAALRLPFGSFDITYAHSNFAIKDGVVSFPYLEMGGAVMQIKGAANYDFMKDDIDATLAILPFAGIKTPIISDVVSVINPLTNAIQATVDGQISDPKIGLKVKPANIIQSQEKIQEEIRSDL